MGGEWDGRKDANLKTQSGQVQNANKVVFEEGKGGIPYMLGEAGIPYMLGEAILGAIKKWRSLF